MAWLGLDQREKPGFLGKNRVFNRGKPKKTTENRGKTAENRGKLGENRDGLPGDPPTGGAFDCGLYLEVKSHQKEPVGGSRCMEYV